MGTATALLILFENEEELLEEVLQLLEGKGEVQVFQKISDNKVLKYDGLVIDPRYRMVWAGEKSIELTNYEFGVLYLLAKRPGQVFSKAHIYNQVWDMPYFGAEDNVMSMIRRIRKKIEPDPSKPIYILTVWGAGYKFNHSPKRE